MNSTYAFAVSRMVQALMFDDEVIGSDIHYLNTCIYPEIARCMWKGQSEATIAALHMTDEIVSTLTDQGFVVRDHPEAGSSTKQIRWCLHPIHEHGQTRLVSSLEFNKWLVRLDDEVAYGRGRESYDE